MNKNNVLVVVDFSAWLYMTIFNAFNSWSKNYKNEYSSMIKTPEETDQDNLPNLLVSESFKKELKISTMKKLHFIDWILKRNCQDILDSADEIVVVFAEDDFLHNNFRKKLFPDYKIQRSLSKKSWDYKKVRDWVVNSILPDLDLYKKNGYIRIGCKGAEADDIIAVMMQDDSKTWFSKILISSDHDFCQIKDIKQFNIFGDEVIPWVDKNKGIKMTNDEVKLIKSIIGDTSDNIPQIFPRVGIKTAWKLCKDRSKLKQMLKENKNAAKQYILNRKLVDFNYIPQTLKTDILKTIHENLDKVIEKDIENEDKILSDLMIL